MKDKVVILNQGFESRTSSTGRTRVTIAVRSEPVIVSTDPRILGAPIAQAIANHFRERITGITAQAAPATIKAREVAARAFALGKPWAVKRYGGGKTGAMPPNQTDRAFNDSGRMAKTITANASSDGNWRINVAANRLSADTGNITRIIQRLSELVPEIANPALLRGNQILSRAIDNALAGAIKKAQATTKELRVEMVRGLFDIAEKLAALAG